MTIERKNRRLGLVLLATVIGLTVYSFFVIKTRGRLAEPESMGRAQKILRGL